MCEQAESDQHTGHIREQPAGIFNHGKDGQGVILAKTRLVEGLALVPQRLEGFMIWTRLEKFLGMSVPG